MVWWLKPWCVFIRFWVQSLMNACINEFCTNVVYKHVHHGEWHGNLFVNKSERRKNNFFLYDDVACYSTSF